MPSSPHLPEDPHSPVLHPLLSASRVLSRLVSAARHDPTQDEAAVQALVTLRDDLARPTSAEDLLKRVLGARRVHPSAAAPAWRDVVRFLMANALHAGVPSATVARLYQADQLKGDILGQPRVHGERLVMSGGGVLSLHEDVPMPPGKRALN